MRSIWNGSISFGLVTIPIKMYSASEDRRLELDMLDSADHARIRYKRINENTGKEVEWKDIVKGYKKGDNYVILEEEDFEQANVVKSKTLEIEAFVKQEEVADVLFKKPYFLEPQKEGGKSYNLLRDSLKKTKKLGLATFVMRQKENLSLIGVYNNILVLNVIRFSDEIRDGSELKLPKTKVSKKHFNFLVLISSDKSIAFEKRASKGIWQNLYQFPLIETESELHSEAFKAHPKVSSYFKDMEFDYSLYNTNELVHKLSHQHLYTKFWIIEVVDLPVNGIPISELKTYPTPILISNFIDEFEFSL